MNFCLFPVGKRNITLKMTVEDAAAAINRRMSSSSDNPKLTSGRNKLGFWVLYKDDGIEVTIAGKHSFIDALEELGRRLK